MRWQNNDIAWNGMMLRADVLQSCSDVTLLCTDICCYPSTLVPDGITLQCYITCLYRPYDFTISINSQQHTTPTSHWFSSPLVINVEFFWQVFLQSQSFLLIFNGKHHSLTGTTIHWVKQSVTIFAAIFSNPRINNFRSKSAEKITRFLARPIFRKPIL